ncbi:MAG: hypothetical protein IKD10_13660 [Lentisphaeria bacterium]|nr:hypothetical protein [Lentisphaeria bacterium]
MKKYLAVLSVVIGIISTLSAGDFNDSGLISGCGFFPLQIDVGFVNDNAKLLDEKSDTVLALGIFSLQQKSAVFSVAGVVNTLQNNYGIQIYPFFLGSATDNNYGISWGLTNFSKKCYGLQLGISNHSFAGEEVDKANERWQLCGVNIADFLFCGLLNFSNECQIGLFNFSKGAIFQLGLLNYNPKSYIPWMPLINCDMGRE